MLSCRSRFEPSGAFESLTCRQRSRSRPISPSRSFSSLSSSLAVRDVVAGCVEVARVEADAEPRVGVESLVERGQLLERAADRPARACRVLHAEPGRLVAVFERLCQGRRDPLDRGLEPGAEVRAHVEDDGLGLDRTRGVDGRAQGRDALLVEVGLRAREVDEVERVDEDAADPELGAALAEGREVGRVVLGKAPGAGALDEELDRVDLELGRAVERLRDPAGAVSAEQHVPDASSAARLRVAPLRRRARGGPFAAAVRTAPSRRACARPARRRLPARRR